MDSYVKLAALAQAAVEALIAGVGIAFFFALGMRGLATWNGAEIEDMGGARQVRRRGSTAATGVTTRNPGGLILAALSFTIVAGIVVVGLYVMLTSK
jgi:hypothetical protein